jgi:hypothetical protein
MKLPDPGSKVLPAGSASQAGSGQVKGDEGVRNVDLATP